MKLSTLLPRRYLGSWTLPSGNACDVYLMRMPRPGVLDLDGVQCQWDAPPSPAWPPEDVEHYQRVTFPEICRAVATLTGQRVLGVTT